jgi:hypothetical protein
VESRFHAIARSADTSLFTKSEPRQSSDSAEIEEEQLGALLKAAAASPEEEGKVKPLVLHERAFRDVRPDFNLKDLHSSESDAEYLKSEKCNVSGNA